MAAVNDATGRMEWVFRLLHGSGAGAGLNIVNSIITDGNGYVYIAGSFSGSDCDFGVATPAGDVSHSMLSSTGMSSGFIARVHISTGAASWVYRSVPAYMNTAFSGLGFDAYLGMLVATTTSAPALPSVISMNEVGVPHDVIAESCSEFVPTDSTVVLLHADDAQLMRAACAKAVPVVGVDIVVENGRMYVGVGLLPCAAFLVHVTVLVVRAVVPQVCAVPERRESATRHGLYCCAQHWLCSEVGGGSIDCHRG